MDIGTLSFALFLVAISAGLVIAHLHSWRGERAKDQTPGGHEAVYAWRKFRRRMQASLMIGLTGVAIVVGNWLPADPLLYGIYWAAVILAVFWIVLLALADLIHTRRHFQRLRDQQLVEQAQLGQQLRQHQFEGNGRARTPSDKTTTAN
ncbi:MAG: hypothetical protein GTO53_02665 [Planctomycetales bacterium]|nr:hypothetical protein [Planctomycetales bacterium]NIM08072.1 hypothetical protein [Planctomycetales bacterium]NIN07563.1 hypothetical protein [Planctomycetales bacterium]NIN76670.1 hypothetical protein [Planctomycetales bacterium]NIO33858.1 hypothetical protein [Planctomycetales bacterium]